MLILDMTPNPAYEYPAFLHRKARSRLCPRTPRSNGRDRPLGPSFYRLHKGKAKAQDKLEGAGTSRIDFPWSRYEGRAGAGGGKGGRTGRERSSGLFRDFPSPFGTFEAYLFPFPCCLLSPDQMKKQCRFNGFSWSERCV